jgi:hypothetical protein
VGINKTAETWVRFDLFCDGLGNDGICVADDLEKITDAAPTEEGARKALINAAAKACWRFDLKLQRWLCPECACARRVSELAEEVDLIGSPPSVPQRAYAPVEESYEPT